MKWTKHKLGDLGKVVTGKTPLTTIGEYWGGEIPFVTPEDLQNGKNISDTMRHITCSGANSVKGAVIPPRSVCVSCIGNLGYISMTTKTSVTNQQINSIIPHGEYSADFLYYRLRSIWGYFKLREGNATTVPILNKGDFSNIVIDLPDLSSQLRIAGVLGSIDEKIELNRKKIAELEALAKTIYDYWFVQFDFPDKNGKPYKSSGGKMVWNEQLKREVPEGWEVVPLSSLAEKITKGTTPTSIGASFSESGIRFIKVENVVGERLVLTPETFISAETHARMARSSLEKNDLLMTIAGRRGDVAIVPHQILPSNTNQAVGIVRFKSEYLYVASYVHAYLSTKQMHKKLQNLNAQSIQKNLNLEIVGQIDILFDPIVVHQFTDVIENIVEGIFDLQEANREFIRHRDMLLPLLMNGQVEIKVSK